MRILSIILEIIIKSFFCFIFTIGGMHIGYNIFYNMGFMRENIDYFIFGNVIGFAIGVILMLIDNVVKLWKK